MTARFIPFRKQAVVEMCLQEGQLADAQHEDFRRFCHLLQSVFHHEFHERLELLKDLYAPMDPDSDTRVSIPVEREGSFPEILCRLLEKANYEQLDKHAIEEALEASSLFQVKLKLDFSEYDEVLLFVRGESEQTSDVSTLWGLFRSTVTFRNFDRVVIYLKYRDDLAPEIAQGRSGATILKLFQNVPRADLEMLFPNTRVAMRNIDKLLIGIPAIAGAVAIFTTPAGTSLLLLATLIGFWMGLHTESVTLDQATLVAILAGLGGVGSYIWKQYSNFKNRKLLFMQSLTRSLYFKNLDNNAGVFYRLVDEAEEEECKEAMLAYYFLLQGALDKHDLDRTIESWLFRTWNAHLDFEVADALAKLQALGLVKEEAGVYSVLPLRDAANKLDHRWDNYFERY